MIKASPILFAATVFVMACAGAVSHTEKQAVVAAEAAFIKETEGSVKQYSVTLSSETPAEWLYLIEGQSAFARPGYHWIVRVDKQTLNAEVSSGE